MIASLESIDATLRHAVFLERLKAGEAAKFGAFLKELDRVIRDRLLQSDLTVFSLKRLKTLLAEIDGLLLGIFGRFSDQLLLSLVEIARYEAQFEATNLVRSAPVGVTFDTTFPGHSAIRSAVLSQPLSVRGTGGGKLLKPFIKDWTVAERQRVSGAIRQGFFEGQTNFQIVRTLRGTAAAGHKDGLLAVTARNAKTVVHTAVQHVAAQARMATIKANADVVAEIEILSTLDSKTTQVCRSMDKQRFPVDSGPRPPFHPNCRTTFVAVTKWSSLFAQGATRASASADGGGQVSAGLSYYGWLKQQPAAFQDEAIGPARGRLLRNGGLTVERFAELQLDRNFQPLTLKQMKDLEPLAFKISGIVM